MFAVVTIIKTGVLLKQTASDNPGHGHTAPVLAHVLQTRLRRLLHRALHQLTHARLASRQARWRGLPSLG
jgi:hypothetical protein